MAIDIEIGKLILNPDGSVGGRSAAYTRLSDGSFSQVSANSLDNYRSGAGKSGIRISDISASMCDGSRRPTGAESNEKTSP